MIGPLLELAGGDERVLVGPETADDAGVYLLGDQALVVTADFITPVCDDPVRFGKVAAANSLSDVYAMGGTPILALNLCCFPEGLPEGVLGEILRGAAETMKEAAPHHLPSRYGKMGQASCAVERNLPMNTDHCLVEREGHVLTVTLNRPEAKNALSGGMLAGMYRAWRLLDEDPELRVAILTGRGDVFCAGADLKAMGGGQKDEEFQKLMAEVPDLH